MSINTTMAVSMTTQLTHQPILSAELAHKIYQLFRYILIPCVSALGILGNMASIVILTGKGFKKCSNVLLMALSVSDVLFLTGVNNIPNHIYLESIPPGFRFSETINYVLYILYNAFACAYSIGIQTALVLPALITGERILAIFSPLTVYVILTSRRVLVVVTCLYILNGTYFMYCYVIGVSFKQFMMHGITVGLLTTTDVYKKDVTSGLRGLLEIIVNYMTGLIPIVIVISGCVVVGIEVGLITHRRKQMIIGQAKLGTKTSPSRTTKTLLSICIVHIVCSGFGFLLGYVVEIGLVKGGIALDTVLLCFQDLLLCVSSVADCVIYVRANNSFRKSSDTKRYLR